MATTRNSLSLASMTGALGSMALIVGAVMLGTRNYMAFFNPEGLMIVVGGTLAVAFMSYQANHVLEALRGIGGMFVKPNATHDNLHRDITNIISWARATREKGMRGLESKAAEEARLDTFIGYSLDMVVSNYAPEDVRTMLETAAEAYYERNTIPARILMSMASHAPAFGMVGTLIGMVIMLGGFSQDMSNVGQGLSVSLIATLYGVATARLLYIPAASSIMQKQDSMLFRNNLITEGMIMLVENKPARFIEDRLNSFLKPELIKRRR